MGKISRRKRLTTRKGLRRLPSPPRGCFGSDEQHEPDSNCESTDAASSTDAGSTHTGDFGESSRSSVQSQLLSDHDYLQPTEDNHEQSASSVRQEETFSTANTEVETNNEDSVSLQDLLMQVKKKVDQFLPQRWFTVVDGKVMHVLNYSIPNCFIIQRSLVLYPNGNIDIFVHNQSICVDPFVSDLTPPMPLDGGTVDCFVDKIVSVANRVRNMQVCGGCDDVNYQAGWARCTLGEVDRNLFQECRFVETFRSHTCHRLVSARKWRCSECTKLIKPLKRTTKAVSEEERHVNTKNCYLTEEQMFKKLGKQHGALESARKKMYYLQSRMQEVIKKESVEIDSSMSGDFAEILSNCDLTPAQSVFLQQQVKASQVKNSCGMRWHPTMIRLALSVHLSSPAAYELLRQTGMVKLPSSSTLFEYSHIKPAEEGIDRLVLDSLAEKVDKFTESHKKFHVLMADEMHISQNLVFQKSSGRLIGYTSLDDIDKQVKNFELWLDNPDQEVEETLASKVLVYMIKGVSNGIKDVVASFAVRDLSANQMYTWTWQVIGALERSGIAIIAFVSDGSSINRAFIKKNKPASFHESGITFDTMNKAVRGRKLNFIADVPHLLKTIRNCILNSRWDGKKSRRKMMKNGKRITWDHIIKLYEMKKSKSLRKSFKLNAMNVYPDSYARMKVKLAAQPLSKTVCLDMRSQGWVEASETENFIELVNNWFDCLNGAHSSQATKTNNPNLAAYTKDNYKQRFEVLDNFLIYLDEWQEDAQNPNRTVNNTVASNISCAVETELDESEIEDGLFNSDCDTPVSKRLLSKQTIDGIRMTTLAFKPLILFMLDQGASFINARIFCQDPLEQHFSKIRSGQGGSNNPNIRQFLNRNRALHSIGELGMKKRKGNSGECDNEVEVTTAKLPKLKWNRVPKFLCEN